VRVRVPASSANLGPGFDSIAMALGLWDEYDVAVTALPGLVVQVEGEGVGELPLDERHLVYRSMLRAWAVAGTPVPRGLHLRCRNGVPQGRGLGSSATAIVAGVAAAYGLLHVASHPHDASCLVDLGAVNDLASAIEGHPDNASASVFGGITLSYADDELSGRVNTIRLDVHPDIVPLAFVPAEQLPTSTARAVLPEHVGHAEAALNAARAALLVEAVTRRPDLLLPATREWLHQEQRRAAFPTSMALLDRLRAAGHAAVISGAGPGVLVLATTSSVAAARAVGEGRGWTALTPGMTSTGVRVERVTLVSHPAESAGLS